MRVISALSLFKHLNYRPFRYFVSGKRTFCQSSPQDNNSNTVLYTDLIKEVTKYRRELRSHLKSSFRHRYLLHSIDNLNQVMAEMECKRIKLETPINDISFIPTSASLEVLSNGLTHINPSVVIKTPLRTYLFNCPEGTSRFLPTLRVKPTNIYDFFITRAKWENIGGVSGLLLAKEVTTMQTRIHGPQRIKQYLECLRPFIDADFGTSKYPVSVEELTYEKEFYEDPAMKVTYIPLFESTLMKNKFSSHQMVDVAYLVEFKAAPRRIDILKIVELKIPKGPLIGRLKSGETVTLPDGRIIRPEDVYVGEAEDRNEKSKLLIAEIENEDKLDCIINNSHMKAFKDGTKTMSYVVHFTPNAIVKNKKYLEWMHSFGKQCTHIVANGTGTPLPQSEGPYIHQNLLNKLNKDVFPLLYPQEYPALLGQDYESKPDSNLVVGNNLQRFLIRGSFAKDDSIILELDLNELGERLKTSPEGETRIKKFRQACAELDSQPADPFPSVVFLGTASAVPSKYRNVSAYLFQLSEKSNILIDCGEGAYGQLRVLFGPEECDRNLLNLNALFITHAHQDHMNGLYLMIVKRIEAFKKHGVKYKPLIVVCNRNVRKPLAIYSRNFDDIEKYIAIVDVSMFMKSPSAINSENIKVPRENSPKNEYDQRVLINVTTHLPKALFSANDWNLRSALAVQVHHTRMANGFIFVDEKNGRKIVFSGDTMPCDLLVSKGHGADLLVHECTFEDGFEDDAFRKRHSTMGQAVDVGRRMEAKHVILSHFSARYTKIPPLPNYLLEANNVSVAMDNMVARFDRLPILPKLLSVFREVYSTELFDMDVKITQRALRKTLKDKQQKKAQENREDSPQQRNAFPFGNKR